MGCVCSLELALGVSLEIYPEVEPVGHRAIPSLMFCGDACPLLPEPPTAASRTGCTTVPSEVGGPPSPGSRVGAARPPTAVTPPCTEDRPDLLGHCFAPGSPRAALGWVHWSPLLGRVGLSSVLRGSRETEATCLSGIHHLPGKPAWPDLRGSQRRTFSMSGIPPLWRSSCVRGHLCGFKCGGERMPFAKCRAPVHAQ